MAKAHQIKTFAVTGRFPFPLDMLRYDCCWPRDVESAAEIGRSIQRQGGELRWKHPETPFKVHLSAWGTMSPTKGRWASFGWQVEEL